MTEALAPGKIILSGEHAVVHGHPALAMAVNRYARAQVKDHTSPSNILFDLLNLSHHQAMPLKALKRLKNRLSRDYHRFLDGHHSIKEVLKLPQELSQFALTHFLETVGQHRGGLSLKTHSDIPMGCGMGSSAAMILCVQYAVAQYLQIPLSKERILSLSLETENLQHGKSSGLDLQVSLQGGCIELQNEKVTPFTLSDKLPLYMMNTGKPLSSTGDCVSYVKHHFEKTSIGEDFEKTTLYVKKSLEENSLDNIKNALRENHRLLHHIGVVPESVNTMIKNLEKKNAAAKICGAGSVAGDAGGIVLIVSEQPKEYLQENIPFPLEIVEGDANGLRMD